MSISAVIITYNEERNIKCCIESLLPIVDEIIILDSFSIDSTCSLAMYYPKVKIKYRKFDNFIEQKNHANSLATGDYILSMDADEYFEENVLDFFRDKDYLNYDLVEFHRINKFQNQEVRFGIWKNDFKIRLWKRDLAQWAGTIPHEHLDYKHDSRILHYRKHSFYHNAYQSIAEMELKSFNYAKLASNQYRSKNWVSLFISLWINPIFKFIKGFFFYQGFRDGTIGWHIARISYTETYLKYKFAIQSKFKSNHSV